MSVRIVSGIREMIPLLTFLPSGRIYRRVCGHLPCPQELHRSYPPSHCGTSFLTRK